MSLLSKTRTCLRIPPARPTVRVTLATLPRSLWRGAIPDRERGMAGVALLNCAVPPKSLPSSSFPGSSTRTRTPRRILCQTKPTPTQPTTTGEVLDNNESGKDKAMNGGAAATPNAQFPELPNKGTNRRIAVASSLAAVGLFLSSRIELGISLKDLAANAVPYEEALSNGMPTVIEFYADWCEVCRELAPDVYTVEQQYKDRVNFVMLNVDNTKWEQELNEFGVEGIPHFAFIDKVGNEEGYIVGRLPRQYLLENVEALVRGEDSVPHAKVVGRYSSSESRKVHQVVDPRSHG